MSYYQRPLANGQTFRCTVCGRIQHLKYVPSRYNPTRYVCRRCSAKTRRRVPNELVSISDDVVITEAVRKRLRKKAETEIPNGIEALENKIQSGMMIFFVITAFILTPLLFDGYSGGSWLFGLGWGLGLPFFINFIVLDHVFAKPKKERNEKIQLRVQELAEDRKREIAARKQVYSAPEWDKLRKQVIKENGRHCAQCRKLIQVDDDLTVDHIRPISIYPDLAFVRENLQVLCRKCNSAKSNREF